MLRDADSMGPSGKIGCKGFGASGLGRFREFNLFCESLVPTAQPSDWTELLERQNAPDDWPQRLAKDFRTKISEHPRKEEITTLVSAGELLFRDIAGRYGYDEDTSRVHSDGYLDAQSFAMALNTWNGSRIIGYSVITRLTHLLDDFLDPPDQVANRELFRNHRQNVIEFLCKWGELGRIGLEVQEYSPWPEGYYSGLRRIFYGALLTNGTPVEQELYLSEYMEITRENLSPDCAALISEIRPLCYSLTNKTVCEVCPMDGAIGNFDAAELRSLCFAPALLLGNLPAEVKKGELNYFGKAPTVEELCQMVDAARAMIPLVTMDYVLLQEQFEFAIGTFDIMLPPELKKAYQKFGESLEALLK